MTVRISLGDTLALIKGEVTGKTITARLGSLREAVSKQKDSLAKVEKLAEAIAEKISGPANLRIQVLAALTNLKPNEAYSLFRDGLFPEGLEDHIDRNSAFHINSRTGQSSAPSREQIAQAFSSAPEAYRDELAALGISSDEAKARLTDYAKASFNIDDVFNFQAQRPQTITATQPASIKREPLSGSAMWEAFERNVTL